MKKISICALLIFGTIFTESLAALDAFEIQVYDSEINEPGKYSVETHLNNIVSGSSESSYDGQIPSQHLIHTTFEFARGMTEYWELGVYVQAAATADSRWKYAGAKLRSKFVIPQQRSAPFQYGMNLEIADISHEFSEDRWSMELRPIFGYKFDQFQFLINPILEANITKNASSVPTFEPATKLSWDTTKGYSLGIEYFGDFEAVNSMLPSKTAEQYLFLVFDLVGGAFEFNIGAGEGLTSNSNNTVVKAILGFEL